ncbi:LysR family transcriptional regulator [Salinimonas sediminis]|uniref:LysR family transcriptional regulator n=1 Tax=Salinimonas sediminis TaxID=2303538 RepID=A0A346NN42_9ALTE|nr:LysR family transcriptional regulator [Salinimonas sediminis]AXR06949.1 LysR family transcriptional regulator [Salinimonas sediminis]
MDIRFLSTFIEVANTRHFGKAAENLFLTQSAVSARIKLLEEYFQTTLFIRHRNSIQLTPAGEKLLPFAHQLSDTLKDAKRELQLESGEYVVCGATQLASELQLSSTLSKIHEFFPDWSVKAEILTLDNLSRQLHERVIDLAFSSEALKSEEVISEEVWREPLGLFSVNDAQQSIDAADFVAIEWGSKPREAVCQVFPQLREARLRTNSLRLALSSVEEEGGCVVLPLSYAQRGNKQRELILLQTFTEAYACVYLNHLKTVKRPALSTVIDQLFKPAS